MMISHLYPEKLASQVHILMPGNWILHVLTPITQNTDDLSSYFLFIQLDLCLERLYSEFHVNQLRNKVTRVTSLSRVQFKFWLILEMIKLWLYFLIYFDETQNITSQDIYLVIWKGIMMASHLCPEILASEVQFVKSWNWICHVWTPLSQDSDDLSS